MSAESQRERQQQAQMENQAPIPITDSKDVWKRGLFMLLFAIAFG